VVIDNRVLTLGYGVACIQCGSLCLLALDVAPRYQYTGKCCT
jgi:hypothetical protein